jgi:hypothetical protein
MNVWGVRPARSTDARQIEGIFREIWSGRGVEVLRSPAQYPDSFCVLEHSGWVAAFLEFERWGGWHAVGGMEDHDPDLDDTLSVNWLAATQAWADRGFDARLLGEWLAQLPEHIQYVVLDPEAASGREAAFDLRYTYARLGFQLFPRPEEDADRPPHLMGWSRPGVPLPRTRRVRW